MSLAKTLLPRSLLIGETFNKLSGIQQDIQNDWQTSVGEVANSYDIDKLNEDDLRSLLASFDLLDLYSSLPPYYLGSLVNAEETQYTTPIAGGRMPFMRNFAREMLRMRAQTGIVKIFDSIMGLLGVPVGQFTVLQNFRYGNSLDVNPTHYQGAPDSGAHPEWDVILERVIYSSVHINGVYEPAPCYRKYGPLVYNTITNPIPGKIDDAPNTPDPIPLTHQAFFIDISGKRMTPTQTVTIDVLSPIAFGIEAEFIAAVRLLTNFLKPTFVVFKDIIPSVYLFMDFFYQVPMSLKGSFVNPQPGAPDYRIDLYTAASADAGTNRFNFTSANPVAAGMRPGMLLTVTGFLANPVINAQIVAIGNTYVQLSTADVTLVTGPGVGNFHADYDHSFQDVLVEIPGLDVTMTGVFSVSAINKISRNDAVPGVTGFDIDGFSKDKLLLLSGFTNDANNIREVKHAIITQVANDYLLISYIGLVVEAAAAQTVKVEMVEAFDMAEPDIISPYRKKVHKPFIEDSSNTMHPVIHQPGPVPTLDTRGSYNRQSATERLDTLDGMHFNNLGARIGGAIEFDESPEPLTLDRFWRGAGNWSDSAKWSFYSDSFVQAPVPTNEDTVYFDEVSSSCIVDINAHCKSLNMLNYINTLDMSGAANMTVEGTANLKGNVILGSGILTLHNSLGGESSITNVNLTLGSGSIRINRTSTIGTGGDTIPLPTVAAALPGETVTFANGCYAAASLSVLGGNIKVYTIAFTGAGNINLATGSSISRTYSDEPLFSFFGAGLFTLSGDWSSTDGLGVRLQTAADFTMQQQADVTVGWVQVSGSGICRWTGNGHGLTLTSKGNLGIAALALGGIFDNVGGFLSVTGSVFGQYGILDLTDCTATISDDLLVGQFTGSNNSLSVGNNFEMRGTAFLAGGTISCRQFTITDLGVVTQGSGVITVEVSAFFASGCSWTKNAAGLLRLAPTGTYALITDPDVHALGNIEAAGSNVTKFAGAVNCDNFTLSSAGSVNTQSNAWTIHGQTVFNSTADTVIPGSSLITIYGDLTNLGSCIASDSETWLIIDNNQTVDFGSDEVFILQLGAGGE